MTPLPHRWLGLGLVLVSALAARAHDPGLSALTVRAEPAAFTAQLTLARADAESLVPLDANHDGRVSPEEFQAAHGALEKLAATALELALDGLPAPADKISLELDPSDAVHFHYTFAREAAIELSICSPIITRLPRGHRQFLSFRDAQGQVLGEKLLDAGNHSFVAKLPAAGVKTEPHAQSFGQFLWLGVEHIAMGWDHLVFLLGLLIVGGNLRDVVKIITSFTLAHSITLALATFDLIRLSSSIVEPLIAASIIYVGLENIFHHHLERRWILTFFFGLVHGCGFASALRDAGIGSDGGGVALKLVSFNLGVELGQLTLAAVVLPLVWQLKKRPHYVPRYIPVGSILIALAGGYWLADRLLPLVRH